MTTSRGRVDDQLAVTRNLQVQLHGGEGAIITPTSSGSTQLFVAEAKKFATTARTSIWMHIRKRLSAGGCSAARAGN